MAALKNKVGINAIFFFYLDCTGPGIPFSNVPVVTGPKGLFSDCRVYIQDRDITGILSLKFRQ